MPLINKVKSSGAGARGGRGLLATRQGAFAAAILVAVVAGTVLLVFMEQYRSSVADEGKAATVLVANGLIAKGSPADVLVAEGMLRRAEIRESQLPEGAVTDPGQLKNLVAGDDILPGQKITQAAFTPSTNVVTNKLHGQHRAIGVKLDASHGLIGTLQAGDHVDVYVGFGAERENGLSYGIVKKIVRNVLVTKAPAPAAGAEGVVVMRLRNEDVPKVQLASDQGRLWLALRPPAGARESGVDLATIQSLITGDDPIIRPERSR